MSQVRIFGIRHHGPGSARRLLAALEAYRPDVVLVEGPPDADSLIRWVSHPEMVPPVALLVYRPDEPVRAAFFPFGRFSPEWGALAYAADKGADAAFMDLPQSVLLTTTVRPVPPAAAVFQAVADAAGADSYESWWNAAVEQGDGETDFFDAVLSLMAEMRRTGQDDPLAQADEGARFSALREAAMRQRIRTAAAAQQRVAVVCGAWHAPALAGDLSASAEADAASLAGLQSVETRATWAAWTHARLSAESGYGAGITSPGWYDHLWQMSEEGQPPSGMTVRWLSRVAALARGEGLDVSAGHVIEAVRLAEALAAMRGRPYPTLDELNEAARSVLFGGDDEPLRLIERELIVGRQSGSVPSGVPALPLQLDLAAELRRLGLRASPEAESLRLDLRVERDLERSRLLHRLTLLEIPWGILGPGANQGGGTASEVWGVRWPPELTLKVIQAAVWGNTVRDAAVACAAHQASTAADLAALTTLVDRVVAADLPEAIGPLLAAIEERAALSFDVAPMMATLPPLAQVLRYGGARRSAEIVGLLRRVFDHLVTRVCIGLPGASVGLGDDAAAEMVERLSATQGALRLAGTAEQTGRWCEALARLVDRRAIHGLVAGRACWLLYESGEFDSSAVVLRLERSLSGLSADDVRFAAAWLDGLLRDSGLLLVHERSLWDELDRWLLGLEPERFQAIVPLLRRTFSGFAKPVREQLLRRALQAGPLDPALAGTPYRFNASAAGRALATTRLLLGLAPAGEEGEQFER